MEKKHLCYCFICGTILIDTRPNRRSKLYDAESSTPEAEYSDVDESYYCQCGCDDLKTINSDEDFSKAAERKEIKLQKEKEYEDARTDAENDPNNLINFGRYNKKPKSPFGGGKF